jgi:hypothetical protein
MMTPTDPIPEAIPIAREAGFHTDTIGTYDHGQFYANIHGALPGDPPVTLDGETHWYAYVHTFDASGNYQDSEIDFIKTGALLGEDADRAQARLTQWLDALPGRRFGDIKIKPFRVEYQGVLFGLVDESEERDGDPWFELYPDGLGFGEPWDGAYDT